MSSNKQTLLKAASGVERPLVKPRSRSQQAAPPQFHICSPIVVKTPPTLLDKYEIDWIKKEIDRVIAKGGKTSRTPLRLPRAALPVVEEVACGCGKGGSTMKLFGMRVAAAICGGDVKDVVEATALIQHHKGRPRAS